MSIANPDKLKTMFPKIKFAFLSNYVIKSSRIKNLKNIQKQKLLNLTKFAQKDDNQEIKTSVEDKQLIDMIFICKNVGEWHKENLKRNKNHYPLIAKYLSYRLVNFFQRRGAKIHYNQFTNENNDLIRYGVVEYEVFKDDLQNWSTLAASTIMHKPFDIIIDDPKIMKLQEKNLTSAICLSALFNLTNSKKIVEVSERDFFKKIIQIPYIKELYFKLLDPINVDDIVDDLIEDFREIYLPILEKMKVLEDWDDNIVYQDGSFIIKNNSISRTLLISNINEEITRNVGILKFTPDKFEDKIFNKYYLDERLIRYFAKNKIKTKKRFQGSINSILRKHQKTRLFFILMSKYFFIGFLLFKYIVKGFVIYYFYKKTGNLHIPFITSKHESNENIPEEGKIVSREEFNKTIEKEKNKSGI